MSAQISYLHIYKTNNNNYNNKKRVILWQKIKKKLIFYDSNVFEEIEIN